MLLDFIFQKCVKKNLIAFLNSRSEKTLTLDSTILTFEGAVVVPDGQAPNWPQIVSVSIDYLSNHQ